jgi:hypothetical protein
VLDHALSGKIKNMAEGEYEKKPISPSGTKIILECFRWWVMLQRFTGHGNPANL